MNIYRSQKVFYVYQIAYLSSSYSTNSDLYKINHCTIFFFKFKVQRKVDYPVLILIESSSMPIGY